MEVNYSTFGSTESNRAGGDYRYGLNGQEKDPEIIDGLYTAAFWEYDSRLGRRWNVDPRTNTSCSPYSCFVNNPLCFIDQHGDTSAVFDQDGNFIKFQDDGKTTWSGMQYQSITATYDDKGKMSTTYNGVTTFEFNDPATDIQAIKNGTITRIETHSEYWIQKTLDASGVNSPEAQANPMAFANTQGRQGALDFGVQGLQKQPDEIGYLESNTFYVQGGVGYNVADFGNYMYGRAMAELGIDIGMASSGAHANNFGSWIKGNGDYTPLYDFGPGTYGSPSPFDDMSDQRAISAGWNSSPKAPALTQQYYENLRNLYTPSDH